MDEEVIEFCVDFIPHLDPIGVPKSREHVSLMTPMLENSYICWRSNHLVLYMLTFQGYEINGNTFYTAEQDKKSTNQNSGVHFDATDENGKRTHTMVT